MVFTRQQEASEMKNQKSFLLVILVALALACLQTVALGQTASQSTDMKVANVRAEGMGVRFDSAIPYSNAILTVSGPDGTVYRREFAGGVVPSLSFFDKTGVAIGSGQYTYELRFTTVQMRDLKQRLAATSDDGVMDENGRTNHGRLSVQSVVQSGSFAVQNGAVYVGNETEPTSRRISSTNGLEKNPQQQRSPGVLSGNTGNRLRNHRLSLFSMPDQVIADDLIVQGSECVGLDCVNNEAFSFDTIRLKENNTRISFNDTSTTAGFPTDDWTIRANSSASGGASFLAFVDRGASENGDEVGTIVFEVDAGAPANALKVDSSGRVGLRTATPVLDMHINTGNTPAHRLEQNSSGGFTAQTWDIAGNEANFFVRDVTGGSRLPFRIRPGAPTSSIDISASGSVGIGTASPANLLDVVKAQDAGTILQLSNTNATVSAQAIIQATADFGSVRLAAHSTAQTGTRYGITFGGFGEIVPTAGNGLLIGTGALAKPVVFGNNNLERMRIDTSGRVGIGTPIPDQLLSVNGDASKTGANTWLAFSDERLKNIKGRFNTGLKAVMQLQPVRYEYKRDNALGLKSEGEHIGFGAQTLQKIIPEAVIKNSAGYLMVNADPIMWTMLNAIKEQQKEIAELKAQVQRLQSASHRRNKPRR
jgi:hypothetical protein